MFTKESFRQFIKFFVVGLINTGVDFAVLNFLIFIFGGHKIDYYYPIFKTVSFLVAVTNSYILNKNWTFVARVKKPAAKEISLFLLISTFGFLLNVLSAFTVFHLIITLYPQNVFLASNVGAGVGTLIVLIFNFVGYKFLVFKN